jgi:hypothetical protein
MTHTVPDQGGGQPYVNCQPADSCVEKMRVRGYLFDPHNGSASVRSASGTR